MQISRRSYLEQLAALLLVPHCGHAFSQEPAIRRSVVNAKSTVKSTGPATGIATSKDTTTPAGTAKSPGKILMVRGVFTVFSLGLDELADRLRRQGYDTDVVPASLGYYAVEEIGAKYAHGELQGPLILIGHSMGADMLPGLAETLAHYRRPVDLVVMIDSTFPSACPSNVRKCLNLYQSNSSPEWFRVFRGAPIQAKATGTQLVNVDIRSLKTLPDASNLDHFNIEESPSIHRLVMNEVINVIEPGGSGGLPHDSPSR